MVTAKAHVENASFQQLIGGTRLLQHAQLVRAISSLTLAIIQRLLRHLLDLGLLVKQKLAWRDPVADASLDLISTVVIGVSIEIAARSILTTFIPRHRDSNIDVVGPTHHLQVDSEREVDVHNVGALQFCLRWIHEVAV